MICGANTMPTSANADREHEGDRQHAPAEVVAVVPVPLVVDEHGHEDDCRMPPRTSS